MHSLRVCTVGLVVLLQIACSPDPEPRVSNEVFQVTLGTRAEPQSYVPATDNIRFISEATNGDIIVAGHGASSYSDMGERTKLMLARIDASGNIKWKQIYSEISNRTILAFATIGDRQYIALSEYIRDSTGRYRTTQRLTLRSVDKDGDLSEEIGSLDNVNVRGAEFILDVDSEILVVAGSDGRNISARYPRRLDIELYEIDLRGNVRMRPFPERIKELRHFRYVGDNKFVYMLTDWQTGMQPTIQRVDINGDTSDLIKWPDRQFPFENVVAARERIFAVHRRLVINEIIAYSDQGNELWRHLVDFDDRIQAMTPLRSGGLIFSSREGSIPTVTRLSPDGEVEWEDRVKSTMQNARVLGIEELENGWIALAGSTGGGVAARDGDALLLVTDPQGVSLARYHGCLADIEELERLEQILMDSIGIEVRSFQVGQLYDPRSEKAVPIDGIVTGNIDCGVLSEHALHDFLLKLVEETDLLNLPNPSDQVKAVINLTTPGSARYGIFWDFSRHGSKSVPAIHVAPGNEETTARYIADEILPYAERTTEVLARFESINYLRMEPDRSAMRKFGILPFGDTIEIAEGILRRHDALSEEERRLFSSTYRVHRIFVSADDNKLNATQQYEFYVGRNRLDDVFDYILRLIPELRAEISRMEMTIKDSIGVSFHKYVGLEHEPYLDALRTILESARDMSESQRALLRQTATSATIGDIGDEDIRFESTGRHVGLKPAAAGRFISEVLANHDILMSQPEL